MDLIQFLQNPESTEATTALQQVIETFDSGEMFFNTLNSENPIIENEKFLIPFIGLFKSWVSNNWKQFEPNHKEMFYSLIQNKSTIINLAEFIGDYIKSDVNCPRIYDNFLITVFTHLSNPAELSIQQARGFITVMHAIIRNYKVPVPEEALDLAEVYPKFMEIAVPLVQSIDIRKSEDGAIILDDILQTFYIIFNRVQPDPQELTPFLEYCKSIIDAFSTDDSPHPLVVASSIRFLHQIFRIKLLNEFTEPIKVEFFGAFIHLLDVYIQKHIVSNILLESILYIIEELKDFIPEDNSLINLFLVASEPSQLDKNDLMVNPSTFYSSVYSTESSKYPLMLARSIIHFIVDKYDSCLEYLVSLEPNETLCRQIAHCAKIIAEKEGGEEVLVQWVLKAVSQIAASDFVLDTKDPNSMLSAASQLFLLVATVKYFPISDLSAIMENVVPRFLNENYSILTIASSKLLYKLIKLSINPEMEAIDGLIRSIGTSYSDEPMKCLRFLCDILPNVMERKSIEILGAIHDYLDMQDSEENQELMIGCIKIITTLIKRTPQVGHNYVTDFVMQLIEQILSSDDSDQIEEILLLIQSIFLTHSDKITDILGIIMKSLRENPNIFDCIDQIIYTFLHFISKCLSESVKFSEFNISQDLINIFMGYMTETTNGSSSTRVITTLIYWIILVDDQVNLEPVLNYVHQSFSKFNRLKDIEKMSIMQMWAALYLARNVEVPEVAFNAIKGLVDNGFCIDDQDCTLFAVFMMKLIDSGAPADLVMQPILTAVNHRNEWIAWEKEDRDNYINEIGDKFSDEYLLMLNIDFHGPLHVYNIAELVGSSIVKCSVDGLFELRNKFPQNFT